MTVQDKGCDFGFRDNNHDASNEANFNPVFRISLKIITLLRCRNGIIDLILLDSCIKKNICKRFQAFSIIT